MTRGVEVRGLTDEQATALARIAGAHGLSKTAFVRQAVLAEMRWHGWNPEINELREILGQLKRLVETLNKKQP